jgi:pseudoazurin
MLRTSLAAATLALLAGAAAAQTTHTVQMLNRGEDGAMVFEPAFVLAQPGDTITFVPTDPGHNAATLDDLVPEGAEPFEGAMNEEVSLTVEAEGLYGVECTPHKGMGMVALIQVGAPTNLEAAQALAEELSAKARERYEAALAQVSEDGAAAAE